MSIFANTDNAPLPGGGRNFNDGRYLCRLEAFKRGVSQQGKGDYVVAEVTVLDTLLGYEQSNKPGERVSWVQLARWQTFPGNCKQFILAATGMSLDDAGTSLVDPGSGQTIRVSAALERATSGDGTTFAGALMIAEAITVTTRSGKPFTKVQWAAADPATVAAYERKSKIA